MKIITTTDPVAAAATQLADRLRRELLAGHDVLWLLSGGSSLTIATATAAQLQGLDLSRLHITLTDERYGEPGHADENWQQLLASGFTAPAADCFRPLSGASLTDTVDQFATWLQTALDRADYVIGIFGIGPDGHTAGIKPHSVAVTSRRLAEGFVGDDFTRLTITPSVIARCNEIVIQSSGADKQAILNDWLSHPHDLADQPAEVLKQVPNATLYTTNTLGDSDANCHFRSRSHGRPNRQKTTRRWSHGDRP